jgi:hypothetical protein
LSVEIPDVQYVRGGDVAIAYQDSEIRILALEIYDDGFALRWVLPSGPGDSPMTAEEAGPNPLGLMSLTLADELGTNDLATVCC